MSSGSFSTPEHALFADTERLLADAQHLGAGAITLDTLVNPEHTRQLHQEVSGHGMSIVRGNIANAPNEKDFRARYELTDAEMAAIGFYRGGGAAIFNSWLRGEATSVVDGKHLDTLLELFGPNGKLPQTKGGEVVYRGLPGSALPRSSVQPGFSSTTISERVAIRFANLASNQRGSGLVERMILEPGIRYLPVGANEREVILQPGLREQPLAFHESTSSQYASFVAHLSERYKTMPTDGIVDAIVSPQ